MQLAARLSRASASRQRMTTTRSVLSRRRRSQSLRITRPSSASRATRSAAARGHGIWARKPRRSARSAIDPWTMSAVCRLSACFFGRSQVAPPLDATPVTSGRCAGADLVHISQGRTHRPQPPGSIASARLAGRRSAAANASPQARSARRGPGGCASCRAGSRHRLELTVRSPTSSRARRCDKHWASRLIAQVKKAAPKKKADSKPAKTDPELAVRAHRCYYR